VDVIPKVDTNWGIAFTTLDINGKTPEFNPGLWTCKAFIDGEVAAILTFNVIDYDELTIHYSDSILPGVRSSTKDKKWDDVWRVQIGVEYKALDWLDLRLGYVYDDSPIQRETADYLLPANDRHLYNFGCGLRWGQWTADLCYTYLEMESRSVSARPEDGVLDSRFKDSHAHLIGSSVGYRF